MTHQLDTTEPSYFQIPEIKRRLEEAVEAKAELDIYIIKLQTALLKQGLKGITVSPPIVSTQEFML